MTADNTLKELKHMLTDRNNTGSENNALISAIVCVEAIRDILTVQKKYQSWEIDSADLHIKEGEILKKVKGALR